MDLTVRQCGQRSDFVGAMASGVTVEWDHSLQDSSIDRALFVFTEVATNNQTRLEILRRVHTCVSLVEGVYRVAVFAKGLQTYRGLVELRAGGTTRLTPTMDANTAPAKTLESVLQRLRIDGAVESGDLVVPKNTRIVLDSSDAAQVKLWHKVSVSDVTAAKSILGNPDALFPGNVPRFVAPQPTVSSARSALLRAAAREYVSGNSAGASDWKREINTVVFDESMELSAFVLGTVTINAGGVLEVGTKSHFLICRLLRMHVASTLLVRGQGPVQIEPLAIETFC
jgi:hypothetical protein